MERNASGKGFKMKGHALPGINQKSETANMQDGRSPSSAFQMKNAGDSPLEQGLPKWMKTAGRVGLGLATGGVSEVGIQGFKGIRNLLGNKGGSGGGPSDKLEDAAAGAELLKKEAKEQMAGGSPAAMKSPMKNYMNPEEYKVFKMGNEPTPVKKLRSGTSATVGGELGGSSYKTASPFNQKVLTPDSKLRKTENPDTWVYKGMSKQEKINDLEDRIEFLQGDLEGGGAQPERDPKKVSKDIASLKRELSTIRKTGKK